MVKSLHRVNQQETSTNYMNLNKGSSETTREAVYFNFDEYIKVKPSHIKKVEILFLEWFIGFVEGDGSFIVGTGACKKRKTIFFCINQKDSQLMFKIKKKLGFGVVTSFVQNNTIYHRYAVYDNKSIVRLIHLFNGNLLSNKVTKRFQLWLHEYNTKQRFVCVDSIFILLKQAKPTLCFHSAWLSGFTDAEGGFYASLTEQKNLKLQYRLRMKFYITQKNELELLKDIVTCIHEKSIQKPFRATSNKNPFQLLRWNFFFFQLENNVFNAERYISKSKDIYRLEVSTERLIVFFILYFEKYPLQGKKHIIFNRWKRIYLNKDILKQTSLISLKQLKRFKRLISSVQNN